MAKRTTKVLEVFLFGHYDSRGGTTAVVARTKTQAIKKYFESGWFDELTKRERRQVVKEDDRGGRSTSSPRVNCRRGDWTRRLAAPGGS